MVNKYASTLVHQWVPKPNVKRRICCSYGQQMILQLGRLYFVGMIVEHQVSRAEESRRRGSWLIEFEGVYETSGSRRRSAADWIEI